MSPVSYTHLADLISYGMGERSIIEIADALASGMDVKDITFIAVSYTHLDVYKRQSECCVREYLISH